MKTSKSIAAQVARPIVRHSVNVRCSYEDRKQLQLTNKNTTSPLELSVSTDNLWNCRRVYSDVGPRPHSEYTASGRKIKSTDRSLLKTDLYNTILDAYSVGHRCQRVKVYNAEYMYL